MRSTCSSRGSGRGDTGADNSAGRTSDTTGGIKNIQLLRDVKYNEMLYGLLAKQYEAARLDEAKDPGVIQVLDQAVRPEHKSKPKRAFIVLMCTAIATIAAIIFVLLLEAKNRWLLSPDAPRKWNELKTSIWFK